MSWPQTLDVFFLRFINQTLSHPLLDATMPFCAWNSFFVPAVLLLAGVILWKGGTRGRLFLILLLVIIALGDMLVTNTVKHAVGRLRPFHDILDIHLLVGRGNSASMPSSHASSWFAATLIAYAFYRRSWRLMLPVALTVSFSRVYVGVHYPSDVLAGAILGAGYASAGLWSMDALWKRFGPAWFPDGWRRIPSLLDPANFAPVPGTELMARATPDQTFLRLGYLFIGVTLFARLCYLANGRIELSEDEAYQWLWSKHLALSYYSKPPLIAYTQFLGTHLWGDNAFGVRFFSPVIAATISLLLLRFMARAVSVRAGFWLVVILHATPLLAVGATLMTIDPLSVLFWTAAMIAGWRAAQPEGTPRQWLWVGLWMGLGLLSKYTALFQLACWALFFALWPPARIHLRRPGPYLALFVVAMCSLPILIWNAQNGWITVEHVAQNAKLASVWKPTLRYLGDFTGAELGLWNPIFFVATLWAMIAFWKRDRANPLLLFFFSMGAPVLIGYWLYTLHSRVLPNWIAPSIVPLFCLMIVYWERRWREGVTVVKNWLVAGLALGFIAVILLHETRLIGKLTGHYLPGTVDPLRRVRAWSDTADKVGEARRQLRAEGREVFIIGAHYGLVGQISFYLPAARTAVTEIPLVYYITTSHPKNQLYFWPGYPEQRQGQNAIFVQETKTLQPQSAPAVLAEEFDSVTDLGVFEITYRGRVFRRVQLFACRNLH